jgi:tRNA threonylcarbamoyladenosine biosynthesis protein TsaB
MKLLAIDSSTELCSVALYCNGEIYQQTLHNVREHNKFILPMIETVLSEANFSLSQLDALVFDRGPGSFTGIRLSASVIQAFALATDLPVIPISSLLILAQSAYRKYAAKQVVACIDARMEEIYLGLCKLNDKNLMEFIEAEKLVKPEQLAINMPGNWVGVGDGFVNYAESLSPQLETLSIALKSGCYPEAYDALTLAINEYSLGNVYPAEAALPVYLRDLTYAKM